MSQQNDAAHPSAVCQRGASHGICAAKPVRAGARGNEQGAEEKPGSCSHMCHSGSNLIPGGGGGIPRWNPFVVPREGPGDGANLSRWQVHARGDAVLLWP